MTVLSKRDGTPIDWAAVRRRMATAFEATQSQSRPSPERARKALEARAAAIAEASRVDPGAVMMLTFAVAGHHFAIETCHVCEVVRLGRISPLPGTPSHVAGIHDLRGNLLPVFDLHPLLSDGAEAGNVAWAVAFGRRQPEFMVLVDQVGGVRGFRPEQIRSARRAATGRTWIRGSMDSDVTLVDGDTLMADGSFVIETRRSGESDRA